MGDFAFDKKKKKRDNHTQEHNTKDVCIWFANSLRARMRRRQKIY